MNLHKLKEMVCMELDRFESKDRLSGSDIHYIWEVTDTIKNLLKIMMLEDGGYSHDDGYSNNGGYSRGGRWEANGMYGMSHDGGYSGKHYVRGHYSRDDGKRQMIEQLESMMENYNGQKHDTLKRAVDVLRNE